MKTVAIVGGGFSGTMAAVNLVRFSRTPLRVELINSRHPLGRGVAYGTSRGEHLLNVAARNMSAVPDHPHHFLEWLRTRVDYSDLPDAQLRETYVPRRVYGDYIRSLLLNYMRPIDDHHPCTVNAIEDEAVDIAVSDDGRAEIALAGGQSIDADRVLLATGNQPPATFEESGENTLVRFVWSPVGASEKEMASFLAAVDKLGNGWQSGFAIIDDVLAEVNRRGGSGAEVLRAAGVDPRELEGESPRISYDRFAAIWEAAAEQVDDDVFGLKLGWPNVLIFYDFAICSGGAAATFLSLAILLVNKSLDALYSSCRPMKVD